VIVGNSVLEAELVKQLPLALVVSPHHVRPHRESRQENGIMLVATFNALLQHYRSTAARSGHSGTSHCANQRHQADAEIEIWAKRSA
jgi:hypothetical protein